MSITSGLAPIRNYANGGDVNTERQNMLAKLGFPSGITNEQLDAAIAKEKNAAYLPESQEPGTTVGQLPGLFKENVFDPTDPVDILTLPFLSAKAAKLAGKAGKKVYDTVRGSGGKVRENLRGISAYVGTDMLADEIRDDSDPFFTKQEDGTYESTRPLPDAQDEAQEDLEDANKKEEEDKEEKTFKDYMSQLGDFQSMLDPGEMTGGYMIKGSGISTPEIKRYEGGGIANMMPIGMAEGGGIDFSKLESLGGMPDTPTMSTGSAIAPANINIPEIKQGNPEALKDAEEDFDKFKTDVKSNYVNFADGGIAAFAEGGEVEDDEDEGGIKLLGKDGILFDYSKPTDYALLIPGVGAVGLGVRALTKAPAIIKAANAAFASAGKAAKKRGYKKKDPKTGKILSDVEAGKNTIIGSTRTGQALRGSVALGLGGKLLPEGKAETTLKEETPPPEPPPEADTRTFFEKLKDVPGDTFKQLQDDPEFRARFLAGSMNMMKPVEGFVPVSGVNQFYDAFENKRNEQVATKLAAAKIAAATGGDFGTEIIDESAAIDDIATVPFRLKTSYGLGDAEGKLILSAQGVNILSQLGIDPGTLTAGSEIPDEFLTEIAVALKDRNADVGKGLNLIFQ